MLEEGIKSIKVFLLKEYFHCKSQSKSQVCQAEWFLKRRRRRRRRPRSWEGISKYFSMTPTINLSREVCECIFIILKSLDSLLSYNVLFHKITNMHTWQNLSSCIILNEYLKNIMIGFKNLPVQLPFK